VAAVKLKLATTPGYVSALTTALADAGARPSAEPALLISTYYDSPDHKLRRQGLCFRVQEQHGDRVQALLGNGRPAPVDVLRGEWRDLTTVDRPHPAAPESGAGLRALVGDELRPLFKTEVRRSRFKMEIPPSLEVGAVLDEGVIYYNAGGTTQFVCELDLDLHDGDPTVLYDLALRLLAAAPLRIETRSQPDRGYLLSGAAVETVTAKPLVLDPSMTLEQALQTIGRECLGHVLRNEPAALAGDAAAFHQMRVALRRLRSALSGVKSTLPPDQYRWAKDELKWLADCLGPTRDWDVFAAELLAPVQASLPDDPELAQLATIAKRRRREAYGRAREAIESRRYVESLLKLARWFESRAWRDQSASERCAPLFAPVTEMAPRLIDRCWKKARKPIAHFAELSQENRHRLRIALKKLRYSVEFYASLFDAGEVKSFMKRLKPLQEELGYLNDVRTTQRLIRDAALPATGGGEVGQNAGLVLGWHIRGAADKEAKLRKRLHRLEKAKPFWRTA
jgi:inorganic triphosphatase YgiF